MIFYTKKTQTTCATIVQWLELTKFVFCLGYIFFSIKNLNMKVFYTFVYIKKILSVNEKIYSHISLNK